MKLPWRLTGNAGAGTGGADAGEPQWGGHPAWGPGTGTPTSATPEARTQVALPLPHLQYNTDCEDVAATDQDALEAAQPH